MFQLLTFTEAHVASVTNRVERHGEDEKPAVSIGLELTAANTILDQIDHKLREALYKAVEGQDQLPGVAEATPVLRCNSIDRVTLPTAHEGWTLQVDDGIDETQPMVFGGVKVDKMSVEPKQGGSIVLRLRCGTSDISAETLGKLGMHNGQSIWITLTAPAKPADAIDASSSAKDLPKSAGDLFTDEHGPADGDDGDDEGGSTDADGVESQGPRDDWPFPDKANNSMEAPPQDVLIETSRPGTRTARGRDRTKAALAAGLAAHEATS